MMTHSIHEEENHTRWDSSKKGFFEVYYLKWNDPSQGIAGWHRYTILSPSDASRKPEVSIWGIFFSTKNQTAPVALKSTFSLQESRIEKEIFYLSGGPSAIFASGARGNLTSGKSQMTWEFQWAQNNLSLRHLPALLYYGGFPKTKYLAPYFSTTLSGEISVNGQRFVLNQIPAHQGHLWGTQQAPAWAWSHCNSFAEDPSFCFEGLSAEVGITRRAPTLLFFYWQGKLYKFNSPRQWLTNISSHSLDHWHFEAQDRDILFVGDVSADPKTMAGVRYENPDGSSRYGHNTKIADLKIQVLKKEPQGWQTIQTLTASKTSAYEVVQLIQDDRVPLLIS